MILEILQAFLFSHHHQKALPPDLSVCVSGEVGDTSGYPAHRHLFHVKIFKGACDFCVSSYEQFYYNYLRSLQCQGSVI